MAEWMLPNSPKRHPLCIRCGSKEHVRYVEKWDRYACKGGGGYGHPPVWVDPPCHCEPKQACPFSNCPDAPED